MKRICLMPKAVFLFWLISCAVFMVPKSLEAAPEITDVYIYTDNYSTNPWGMGPGHRVLYGGYVRDSSYAIDHVDATYLPPPASPITWSENLPPYGEEYGGMRSPENFSGLGAGQTWGRVRILATNTQGESTTVDTPELYHPLMIPLASNIRFSNTGLTPTITWNAVRFDHDLNPATPEVPVDYYHLRIYRGDTLAEIFRTQSRQGFTNPTFQAPPGVLSPETNYWVRIISYDLEQVGETQGLMNRSSTYALFITSPVNACECDLNSDGRCDMRDWLLFGQDWGRTDCPRP